MKDILNFIFLVLNLTILSSGQAQTLDPLWQSYRTETVDSNKVKILLDVGYALEMDDPDSALAVYQLAVDLGNSSNYLFGVGRGLMFSGIVKSSAGDYAASLQFYDQALAIFQSVGYEIGVASTLINKGVVYNYRGEYEQALEKYLAGIRIYEKLNERTRLVYCYGNIGGIFVEMSQVGKGKEYFQKQLTLSQQLKDSLFMADAHNNMGMALNRLMAYDSAEYHYKKALTLVDPEQSTYLQFLLNNNMADVLANIGHDKEAIPYSQLALKYSQTLGNPYNIGAAYRNLGVRYISVENYTKADLFLDSAVQVGKQINLKDLLADSYQNLAQSSSLQGDFEAAYNYQLLHTVYTDSVFSEKQVKTLNELNIVYETDKKDHELAVQELDLERSRSLQIKTMALLGVLALVIIFMILFFRQKQRLKDQKLEAIFKEQEIRSIRSMMDGEEKERRRIARDLHDGLSALLASVKMKFSALQSANEFEQALLSLDDASQEVRRIAHSMMPEVLLNYGLVVALKEFLDGISGSDRSSFRVDFQQMNMNGRMESSTELMIYRVIQELINNIIKHADAKNVLVQLVQTHDQLTITVEDDGKGFNVEDAIKKNGIGMANLRSRIDFLGGKMNFDSSAESGTSVYIELNLN